MSRCDLCKRKCGLVMFTCPCCKMQFCVSHRLPECHDCKNYDLVKEKTKIELVKLEETKRALVRF